MGAHQEAATKILITELGQWYVLVMWLSNMMTQSHKVTFVELMKLLLLSSLMWSNWYAVAK